MMTVLRRSCDNYKISISSGELMTNLWSMLW